MEISPNDSSHHCKLSKPFVSHQKHCQLVSDIAHERDMQIFNDEENQINLSRIYNLIEEIHGRYLNLIDTVHKFL